MPWGDGLNLRSLAVGLAVAAGSQPFVNARILLACVILPFFLPSKVMVSQSQQLGLHELIHAQLFLIL
eukprot:scaffold128404_cov19-Tisochrysis_lutea.AAC.2